MPYEAPVLRLPIPSKGAMPHLPREQVPEDALYSCFNLLFRNGKAISRPGYGPMGGSLSVRPNGLVAYTHSGGSQKIVASTKTGWFQYDLTTKAWVNITEGGNALTASDDHHQIFRIFYKSGTAYLVGCNGIDAPVKWDGSAANYTDVGGTPGAGTCMAVLANRMLLGNFSGYPVEVKVSALNDFESGWTTQVVELADTPGEIVAMQEFGALLAAVYKTDAIYLCTATGGTYPFSFNLKMQGISGPWSPRCVVPTPGRHYILARDNNLYTFDGSSYTVLTPAVQAFLSTTSSTSKMNRAFGWYNAAYNEVWFVFPNTSGKLQYGFVVRQDGSFWPIVFTMSGETEYTAGLQFLGETVATIGSLTSALSTYTSPLTAYTARASRQLVAGATGQVYEESGFLDNGSFITFNLLTGTYCPSKDFKTTTVTEVVPIFKKSSSSQSFLGSVRYSDSNAQDTMSKSFTLPPIDVGTVGPYRMGCRATGKFFGVYLGAALYTQVTYEGMVISAVERGRR